MSPASPSSGALLAPDQALPKLFRRLALLGPAAVADRSTVVGVAPVSRTACAFCKRGRLLEWDDSSMAELLSQTV